MVPARQNKDDVVSIAPTGTTSIVKDDQWFITMNRHRQRRMPSRFFKGGVQLLDEAL